MKKLLLIALLIMGCSNSTEPEDCAGVAGGTAELDNCNVCDTYKTNDCVPDCAGVWGGSSVLSGCDNVCNSTAVVDCAGDGDCAPASFVGDGWCDGEDQPFGYDLTCYDNDGGDCETTDGDDDDCYNVGYDDPCPTLDCCTYPYIKDCSCNGS